jgi:hypothetical protein
LQLMCIKSACLAHVDFSLLYFEFISLLQTH